jgi:hypothetical protein
LCCIQSFINQLQQFFLAQGPALSLSFVGDGTIIGPHALVFRGFQLIQEVFEYSSSVGRVAAVEEMIFITL